MQLSENTITILKNFMGINSSILFRKGSTIRTISPQKTMMARAEVDEHFDRDFGIYDLPRFLAVLSLFEKPEIVLGEHEVTIRDNKRKLNYVYADSSMFTTPPEKDITFPDTDIKFDLETNDFQKVLRAGLVLQLPEIAVTGDGSQLTLEAIDSRNPTADSFRSTIGDTDLVFRAVFKNENLKVIANDYHVSITPKGLAMLSSPRLTYWIAVEANSAF